MQEANIQFIVQGSGLPQPPGFLQHHHQLKDLLMRYSRMIFNIAVNEVLQLVTGINITMITSDFFISAGEIKKANKPPTHITSSCNLNCCQVLWRFNTLSH